MISCKTCTFDNPIEKIICEVCSGRLYADIEIIQMHETRGDNPGNSKMISCPICSLDNDTSASECVVCGHLFIAAESKLNDNTSNSMGKSKNISLDELPISCFRCGVDYDKRSLEYLQCSICDADFPNNDKQRIRRGRCHYCKDFGHWQSECPYIRNQNSVVPTRRAGAFSSLTSIENDIKEEDIRCNYFPSSCATAGILELLNNELVASNVPHTFNVCSPTAHITQIYKETGEGQTWSCGYRNIQMLCSSLMTNPVYRRVLFAGREEIPDIHGLQSWIETAWREGFDPVVIYICKCVCIFINLHSIMYYI
jgi:hypothetical protein